MFKNVLHHEPRQVPTKTGQFQSQLVFIVLPISCLFLIINFKVKLDVVLDIGSASAQLTRNWKILLVSHKACKDCLLMGKQRHHMYSIILLASRILLVCCYLVKDIDHTSSLPFFLYLLIQQMLKYHLCCL